MLQVKSKIRFRYLPRIIQYFCVNVRISILFNEIDIESDHLSRLEIEIEATHTRYPVRSFYSLNISLSFGSGRPSGDSLTPTSGSSKPSRSLMMYNAAFVHTDHTYIHSAIFVNRGSSVRYR